LSNERASVREWTDLLARIRFGTVKVAGKNITGATIKAVAGRLASYADSDGSRVRPGLPRLAVDLELDHGTVKRAVQLLARLGLLQRVRAGARPGHADEYQLAIPARLLEETEVWTPARHTTEVARVRQATRGRYRRRAVPDPDPADLLVPHTPADAGPADTCRPAENPDLLVPAGPAEPYAPARPAGASRTDIRRPAGASGTDLQVPQGPATDHGPRHNYDRPHHRDLRSKPQGPRTREGQISIFPAAVPTARPADWRTDLDDRTTPPDAAVERAQRGAAAARAALARPPTDPPAERTA
jgi:hypothetical protein